MVLPFHRFAMLHKKQAVAQHQFQRTVRHNITVAPLNHNNQRSFRERQFANMTSPLQKLFRTKHFASRAPDILGQFDTEVVLFFRQGFRKAQLTRHP